MQRPPLLFQGALPEARPLVAVGAGEEEVPQGTFVRTTWPTGLFGCFAGQAFGTSDTLDCCCASAAAPPVSGTRPTVRRHPRQLGGGAAARHCGRDQQRGG